MAQEARPTPYSVLLRARPLRAAFIVDAANTPPKLVDDLFQSRYGTWGGRLNPIVPAHDGRLNDFYRRLLIAADPDVVISYAALNGDEVTAIDDQVCPWSLIQHHPRNLAGAEPDFHPSIGFHSDATEALPFLFEMPWSIGLRPVLVTLRANPNWLYYRWFTQNFGNLHPDIAHRTVPQWEQITVTDDWDDVRILSELAAKPYLALPAHASAVRSLFFEPETTGFNSHYSVIVGDTPSDWLMFWNRIFTLKSYQWGRWHTLCVPAERFDNQQFVEALRNFLGQHASRSGNSPPDLFIRSSSVTGDDLQTIRQQLSPHLDVISHVESLAPWTVRAYANPADEVAFSKFRAETSDRRRQLEQQAISSPVLLQRPPSDIPLKADWVLDVEIEFQARFRFFSNEKLWWVLPKRQYLPLLFMHGHVGRIARTGNLSFRMGGLGSVELTLPSPDSALDAALRDYRMGIYAAGDIRHAREGTYDDVRRSDKGRYINGILELFGGLQATSRFFENSFWRGVVEHICHRDTGQEDALLTAISNKLRKRRAPLIQQLQANDFSQLSTYLLALARAERSKEHDITWEWLQDRYIHQRRSYIRSNPQYLEGVSPDDLVTQPNGRNIEEDRATKDLKRALQGFLDAKIFFKGVRYRCRQCGFGFWRDIAEANHEIECEGCREPVTLRVEAEWVYRLNNLVRSGVAFHGVIPVIWTLARLRSESRTGFIYSPSIELYNDWADESPAGELDFACLADGRIVVGEVKNSASEFSEDELRKFGELARRVNTHIAVVAAFRDRLPAVERYARRLEQLFPDRSFKVRALAPDEDIDNPEPSAL